jgi:predicted nuclease of predicted toxin-antitoxin system
VQILADENCDGIIVSQLRSAGHDVASVMEIMPGAPDAAIFLRAAEDHRVLLTHDHDFGLIAERAQTRPPAVVLMRLGQLSALARAEMVMKVFAQLGESLLGRFVVIEPEQVRDRALKR